MFGVKKKRQMNKGMSYVELIVVLSIFSALSAVSIFNYGGFQSKVDIKNLASDIALKIVEAQKASLSGQLPPLAQQLQISPTWKPAYGVYFDMVTNNNFIYFTDLDQSGDFNTLDSGCSGNGECLDKITITKNNTISSIEVSYQNDSLTHTLSDLNVSFSRPNSGAVLTSSGFSGATISLVQINILSPNGAVAAIKLYPSGRIQVN